jgi:hypothetical protein
MRRVASLPRLSGVSTMCHLLAEHLQYSVSARYLPNLEYIFRVLCLVTAPLGDDGNDQATGGQVRQATVSLYVYVTLHMRMAGKFYTHNCRG